MNCFLDTNAWIDFLLVRESFYLPVATLLTFAEKGLLTVTVSSQSVINSQYICCERAKMTFELWKEKVNTLLGFVHICSVDESDIKSAYNSQWRDFEDAVQYS